MDQKASSSQKKLKALKAKIKIWNKEVFGTVEANKKAAMEKVAYWDKIEGHIPLTNQEQEVRVQVKGGL